MRRRLPLEIAVGLAVILAFFYRLYLRPQSDRETLPPDAPALQQRLASTPRRTLVIGIDGLSWPALLEFANQGRLPNLARLVATSPHGILRSRRPLISSVSWTTLATGQPPATHGIEDVSAKVPFEYREERLGSNRRRAPALWEMYARAGRRVALVNWPAATEEKPAGGVFIAENTDPRNPAPGTVWPEAWRERIRTAERPSFPEYEQELARAQDPRMNAAYELDRGISAAAEAILKAESPDLMLVQFGNLSALCHGFWKQRWPLGLDHVFSLAPDERERYRQAIEFHYELLDRLVGGLVAAAPDYTVIVISAYGQGPSFPPGNIELELNRLLERLSWLTFEERGCDQILLGLASRGELNLPDPRAVKAFDLCQELEAESATFTERGEAAMPAPAVEAFIGVRYSLKEPGDEQDQELRSRLMEELARTLLPASRRQDILWSKTKAWNPRDFRRDERGLYLNLAEREPEGLVPRPDYASERKALIGVLRSLRTESGQGLFASVRANPDKGEVPFSSPDPPDILVTVNRKALVEEYLMRGPADQDPIPLAALRWSFGDVSAENTPKGVFIASGPGAGSARRQDLDALDFAPTLLAWLGLPVGADMPGAVRPEILPGPEPALYIESWSRVIPR